MKLALIGPYPFKDDKIEGGVEAVTAYLIEGLKRINSLTIHVIACRAEIAKEKIVRKESIFVHYLPSQKHFGNISLGFMARRRVRKKIEDIKPDIIHFESISRYAYFKSKPPYPTVTTVHGIVHKEVIFEKGLINWVRKFPRIYMEKISLKNNDHIICNNEYAERVVRSLSSAKVYIVPNPISEKFFKVQNAEIPGRVLLVTPIWRLKNILELLKAVHLVKNRISSIKLHIVGQTRDYNYLEILRNYVNQNSLETNVKFLGHIPEYRLLHEYEECCILALTSHHENSPMVIQQAMAAGKPVIATRIGGVPYLFRDGESGFLVNCGDIKSLAEKIELVLCHDNLRKRMGRNAQNEALRKFKTEIVARKTYQVYKAIINGNIS